MSVDLRLSDWYDYIMTVPGKSIDAIITDLPYGTTACKWDNVIPFEPMWEQVKRVLKDRGAFVTTASQPFTSALVMSNTGWFRYCCVWEKTNSGDFMLAKIRPRMKHEDICVFSKNGHQYNPQMQKGKPYKDHPRKRSHRVIKSSIPNLGIDNNGTRYPSSVQKFSNGNNDIAHPTQKPVALYEYLIRTYTNEGDTVMDFCCGSGTTAVACVNTGRHFTGCDNEPEYFDIAQKRIAEAQKQPSLFEAAQPVWAER